MHALRELSPRSACAKNRQVISIAKERTRRRTEEKPGSREMNLRKKMQEEKTLSRRQFLTTFRTPMTPSAVYKRYLGGDVGNPEVLAGRHAASASSVNQIVISPRWRKALLYSGQLVTL
jgi:hypothetical protein